MNLDLATRLAMFPYKTQCSSSNMSVHSNGSVLVEQSCPGDGHDLWPPIDLDFPISGYRHSAMLFVDSDGAVWTATHTDILMEQDYEEVVQDADMNRAWRIWMDAGSSHFSIQSEAGFEFELRPDCLDSFTERDHPLYRFDDPPPMPGPVKQWLIRHPVLTDRLCWPV